MAEQPRNPLKLTRLCWNTHFWRQPSGPFGKSTNEDTYEHENGFGHEEWLFDTTRTIDGWKYGFVQAVRPNHAGDTYDVLFYTLNAQDPRDKSRWLIARVSDLEILTQEQMTTAFRIFRKNGWITHMHNDLRRLGLEPEPSLFSNPSAVVNVRYRPASLQFFDPIEEMAKRPSDRYKLFNLSSIPTAKSYSGFNFIPGRSDRKSPTTREFSAAITVPDDLHMQIQRFLFERLSELFGADYDYREEHPLPRGRSIDLLGQNKKSSKFTIYEIKTAIPARQSIREALGQLLEYAYHPEGNIATNIEDLVVVGPQALNLHDRQYLTDLRRRSGLPIYYQQCDLTEGVISERF